MTETMTATMLTRQMRAIKNLQHEFSQLDNNTIAEIWSWLADEVSKGTITTVEKLLEEAFEAAYDVNEFDRALAEDDGYRISQADLEKKYGL
jgi:hypothetical protein